MSNNKSRIVLGIDETKILDEVISNTIGIETRRQAVRYIIFHYELYTSKNLKKEELQKEELIENSKIAVELLSNIASGLNIKMIEKSESLQYIQAKNFVSKTTKGTEKKEDESIVEQKFPPKESDYF